MKLGSYEVKLEKKLRVTGWEAATISILAILIALALVGLIFLQARGQSADGLSEDLLLCLCKQVWPATDDQQVDLHTAVHMCIHRPDEGRALEHWDGRAALRRGAGRFWRRVGLRCQGSQSVDPVAGNRHPADDGRGCIWAARLIGAIPGFLKGRFNTNEIVVTMMLNSIAFWLVAFMIKEGGLFMGAGGEGEGFKLPESLYRATGPGGALHDLACPWIGGVSVLYVCQDQTGLSDQGLSV